MKPKYCKDCAFVKLEYIPRGQGFQSMFLCENINCSDPVDASPIPCGLCRKESILCGMQGKYYQEKAKVARPPEDNVIQLETIK